MAVSASAEAAQRDPGPGSGSPRAPVDVAHRIAELEEEAAARLGSVALACVTQLF